MITLIVDDCTVEVIPEVKSMTVSNYKVNIVGYDALATCGQTLEISGPREFSKFMELLQQVILEAMSNIDSWEH